MKERYYDLNGREGCITAIITISDRTFRISRVVIAVRTLYSNHIIEMGDMLKKLSEADEDDRETALRLSAEAEEFARKKAGLYEHIITLLLEKNGYEYDKAWWDENTDEADRRLFIERCLMKDSDGNEKKKDKAGK